MDEWHILHKTTATLAPPGRLKSRRPYNKAAQTMLQSIPENLSRAAWLAAAWKQSWETAEPSRIQRPADGVEGQVLPRHKWTTLNRLRCGVGRFNSCSTSMCWQYSVLLSNVLHHLPYSNILMMVHDSVMAVII